MATFTYDDFEKAANKAGLWNQFSQADLNTAKSNPDFGMSILNLKQNYGNAATDEERQKINDQANALRSSYGNYTGGADGSQFVSTGLLNSKIDDTLGKVASYAPFSYAVPAPAYSNQYADRQAALLDEILNRKEFEWSKETDPNWAAYKKEYLREGDRAAANALAQASAASGGRPSSYAATAASQAGDYYAGQLADKIPELYQQAYERYLNDYNMKLSDLSAVNSQEQMDYAKFLDSLNQYNTDRNFAYNDYQTQYNMLQSYLANLQGQQQTEFNQNLTARQYQDEIARYQQEQKQAQIDAILSAGGTPGAELMNGSGYVDEYAQALAAAYAKQEAEKQQAAARELADWYAGYGDYSQLAGLGVDTAYLKAVQAAQLASGSSGGSSGSGSGSSSKPAMTLAQANSAIENGLVTDAVKYAFDYYMGEGAYEQFYGDAGLPTADGGYKLVKYSQMSDKAKQIADLIDSDLTTNYGRALELIEQLTDENEQYTLLRMAGYQVGG